MEWRNRSKLAVITPRGPLRGALATVLTQAVTDGLAHFEGVKLQLGQQLRQLHQDFLLQHPQSLGQKIEQLCGPNKDAVFLFVRFVLF